MKEKYRFGKKEARKTYSQKLIKLEVQENIYHYIFI